MMVVAVMMVLVFVFVIMVVLLMTLVVVDFFFISYVYKSSVYLKKCCNITLDKKIATNSQKVLLSSASKSLHCQKLACFLGTFESRVLKRGNVVF